MTFAIHGPNLALKNPRAPSENPRAPSEKKIKVLASLHLNIKVTDNLLLNMSGPLNYRLKARLPHLSLVFTLP